MSLLKQNDAAGLKDHAAHVKLGAVLAVWLSVAVVGGSAGWFVTRAGVPPLALLAAGVIPVGLFGGAYATSERFRQFVRDGDPRFLTTLQSWRVLGGVFLVLLSFGLLPAPFAIPAGAGDVAIGLTAPFIARARDRRDSSRVGRLFVAWQWLGVLDLVVAVGVGASLRTFPGLASSVPGAEHMVTLSLLPLSLVPTFAVPLFLILHFASLVQVRFRRAGEE